MVENNTADMLTNIAIVLVAITLVLKGLQVLLSSKQKAAIELLSLRLWEWLDSRKRITLRQHMVLPPLRQLMSIVMGSTSFPLLNYLTDDFVGYYGLRVTTPLSIFILLSGEILWPRIAKTMSNVKLAAFSAILLLTYAALVTLGALYLDYCCVANRTYWILHHPWRVLAFATLIIGSQAVFFILLRPFISLIGRPILWSIELLVRRINEYEKGPVIGLSILVGSIAGLIKLF